MNVLFLTLARFYDANGRGIYTDLMRKFRDEGHQVYVVSPRERRLGVESSLTCQDGINILAVKTLNLEMTSIIEKGLATLLIENQYEKAVDKYLKGIKFDLILFSTPPITFTKVIKKMKKKYNAKSYLLLKDIFPQNAVDLEMFSKKSPLYWLFRRKEEALYRVSDYIGCMSPANVDFVVSNNPTVDKTKVEVCPNSIELVKLPEINKNEIRKRYGLPTDKPIFIYGGNLGKPQGVGFLMEVLEANAERNDCFFLVIGAGTEFSKIKEWFEKHQPKSAKLMAGLPKQEYDDLVRCCDVGLIFLDRRFTIPNYPSRLLSYMENKMPVLAATDKNTDIGKIAQENGYGFWCESLKAAEFTTLIDKFVKNTSLITHMGNKAFQYLLANYQVGNTYQVIMSHMKD